MTEPKKRGRPPTERGAYNPNPARQLGRVSDAEWKTLQEAARAAGLPFTRWAVPILLAAATPPSPAPVPRRQRSPQRS
jgi:alpha-beta hydrolase superfamily lysophospholipase